MYPDDVNSYHVKYLEQEQMYNWELEDSNKLYSDYEFETEDICFGRLLPGMMVGRISDPYSTFICALGHQHRVRENVQV